MLRDGFFTETKFDNVPNFTLPAPPPTPCGALLESGRCGCALRGCPTFMPFDVHALVAVVQDLVEEWFGLPFTAAPIPAVVLNRWSAHLSRSPGQELTACTDMRSEERVLLPWDLPSRNPYVPSSFDLATESCRLAPLQPPALLGSSPSFNLWHRCRVFNGQPVATVLSYAHTFLVVNLTSTCIVLMRFVAEHAAGD
jgi:hypothetical protein